jgi:hypothetical protein
MYPLGTLSTKKLLSFIRSAISAFAPWYLRCLFFRFVCFLQQPSHPILVPQTKNCQSDEFRWAVPDAPVETLTGYSEPLSKFHLGQAKLLANPVKLSPIHFCNANALKPACPEVLHAQPLYEPASDKARTSGSGSSSRISLKNFATSRRLFVPSRGRPVEKNHSCAPRPDRDCSRCAGISLREQASRKANASSCHAVLSKSAARNQHVSFFSSGYTMQKIFVRIRISSANSFAKDTEQRQKCPRSRLAQA